MKNAMAIVGMVALSSLVLLSGCGRRRSQARKTAPQRTVEQKSYATPQAPEAEQTPSSGPGMLTEVQNTVEGMAGGAAFRAGQKAKSRVKNLNQQHNSQLDEALKD